jgi:hypothetical protein
MWAQLRLQRLEVSVDGGGDAFRLLREQNVGNAGANSGFRIGAHTERHHGRSAM